MNIVFMGTSLFAAIVLRDLCEWAKGHGATVSALYCQPDRPAGRGHKLVPPPTKTVAEELGIPVYQPLNFKDEADREMLRSLKPDVLAVASYGLILPQAVLDIPTIAPLNVHASLLPRYRGAAPIERALMNGDMMTGITIMRMEAGLDTGPMLAQRAMGIDLDETAGDLHEQLAHFGASLLAEVLEETTASGGLPRAIPQDDRLADYAAKLTKNDSYIDWSMSVRAVHAHLRGVTPRPGARTVFELDGKTVAAKIMPARLGRDFFIPFENGEKPAPGTLLGVKNNCLAIACSDAMYLVPSICPADRKFMDAAAFWNGYVREVKSAAAIKPVTEEKR